MSSTTQMHEERTPAEIDINFIEWTTCISSTNTTEHLVVQNLENVRIFVHFRKRNIRSKNDICSATAPFAIKL